MTAISDIYIVMVAYETVFTVADGERSKFKKQQWPATDMQSIKSHHRCAGMQASRQLDKQ